MMPLTKQSIIKRNPKIISQKFAGSVYVIDHRGQTVRILNRTAGFIWEKINKKIAIGDLIGLTVEEFEVSADRAAKDIRQFIGSYLKQDLIILK